MSSWKERLAARRSIKGEETTTKKNKSEAGEGLSVSTAPKKMTWKERLAARKKEKEEKARNDEIAPLLSTSPTNRDLTASPFGSSPKRGNFQQTFRQSLSKVRLDKFGLRADPASDRTPEVHILGEIIGGKGFGPSVSCKWQLVCGSQWTCLGGSDNGQTQFDSPAGVRGVNEGSVFVVAIALSVVASVIVMVLTDSIKSLSLIVLFLVSVGLFSVFLNNARHVVACNANTHVVWDHPVDVHYTTRSLEGFPKIVVHVWNLDEHDCASLVAYGYCAVPMASGTYELTCRTWRPVGTSQEELTRSFVHAGPTLKSDAAIYERFSDDRPRLSTIGSGVVTFRLSVVMRNISMSE